MDVETLSGETGFAAGFDFGLLRAGPFFAEQHKIAATPLRSAVCQAFVGRAA